MKNGLRKKLAIICAHASSVVRKGRGGRGVTSPSFGGDLPPLFGGPPPRTRRHLGGRQEGREVPPERGGRSPQKGRGGPPRKGGEEVHWTGGVEVENAGRRRGKKLGGGGVREGGGGGSAREEEGRTAGWRWRREGGGGGGSEARQTRCIAERWSCRAHRGTKA